MIDIPEQVEQYVRMVAASVDSTPEAVVCDALKLYFIIAQSDDSRVTMTLDGKPITLDLNDAPQENK